MKNNLRLKNNFKALLSSSVDLNQFKKQTIKRKWSRKECHVNRKKLETRTKKRVNLPKHSDNPSPNSV